MFVVMRLTRFQQCEGLCLVVARLCYRQWEGEVWCSGTKRLCFSLWQVRSTFKSSL